MKESPGGEALLASVWTDASPLRPVISGPGQGLDLSYLKWQTGYTDYRLDNVI